MSVLVLLDLLAILGAVVTAFVWMRPVTAPKLRVRRVWTLLGVYAAAVLLLWWVGLLRAGYPAPAALLVGGVVAVLHVAFVGLVLWLAAQRPKGIDA